MPASKSISVIKMLKLFLNPLTSSAISKSMYITSWKNDLTYFFIFCQNKTNIKELLEGTEINVCYVSLKRLFFLIKLKKTEKDGQGKMHSSNMFNFCFPSSNVCAFYTLLRGPSAWHWSSVMSKGFQCCPCEWTPLSS